MLEGLEAVRKRPGMYIGSTGERGLHHLIWEIVDNSVDEALAGHCDRIVVTLQADGAIRVEDNGRGIPTDTAPGQDLPAVTLALTMLHAGGKFGGGGYKVSGGLHGVGVSVVNALSSQVIVEVKNRGHLWRQSFRIGVPEGELEQVRELEPGESTGTTITYWASEEIFETTNYSLETITSRGSGRWPSSTRASRSSSATSGRPPRRSSRPSRTTPSPATSTRPAPTRSARARAVAWSGSSSTNAVWSTTSSTSTAASRPPTRRSSPSRPRRPTPSRTT